MITLAYFSQSQCNVVVKSVRGGSGRPRPKFPFCYKSLMGILGRFTYSQPHLPSNLVSEKQRRGENNKLLLDSTGKKSGYK